MPDILQPTEGQRKRISKLLKYTTLEEIRTYFYKKFPKGDFDKITRQQAQKIITGLDYKIPTPVLRGVVEFYG